MQAIDLILNVPWAGDEFKFAAVCPVSSPSGFGYEILYSDEQTWYHNLFGFHVTNGKLTKRVQLPDTVQSVEDWQYTSVTIDKWKSVHEKPTPVQAKLILQIADGATGTDISHFSEQQRANIWIVKGSRGSSSECIWAHMMGIEVAGSSGNYPRDTGDFNRCLLLLEAVPEWKSRMKEMASHGRIWAAMAESWDEITRVFLNDVGLNWSKGRDDKAAYDLIKKARGLNVDG